MATSTLALTKKVHTTTATKRKTGQGRALAQVARGIKGRATVSESDFYRAQQELKALDALCTPLLECMIAIARRPPTICVNPEPEQENQRVEFMEDLPHFIEMSNKMQFGIYDPGWHPSARIRDSVFHLHGAMKAAERAVRAFEHKWNCNLDKWWNPLYESAAKRHNTNGAAFAAEAGQGVTRG